MEPDSTHPIARQHAVRSTRAMIRTMREDYETWICQRFMVQFSVSAPKTGEFEEACCALSLLRPRHIPTRIAWDIFTAVYTTDNHGNYKYRPERLVRKMKNWRGKWDFQSRRKCAVDIHARIYRHHNRAVIYDLIHDTVQGRKSYWLKQFINELLDSEWSFLTYRAFLTLFQEADLQQGLYGVKRMRWILDHFQVWREIGVDRPIRYVYQKVAERNDDRISADSPVEETAPFV